ncbi:MAG: MarR family transcriptional regulator [Alphaproteobacteria bacterium]|nr:MarR family transcriptional regulator [Alphaproteobacteria bacterium]
MKQTYLDTILLIERLHRRFLDVVKTELDRLRIDDINNVQTLILYNIGNDQLTVGELTNRGYYLGTNVSYNVKNLVESGYLVQEKAPHDKRSTRVSVSEKGLKLVAMLDALFEKNVADLEKISPNLTLLSETNKSMHQLERYWTDYINRLH